MCECQSLLFSVETTCCSNMLFTLSVYHQCLSHVKGDKCELGHFKVAAPVSD